MDQPRPSARGSTPNIDFENSRRDSDQLSARITSHSKSPLRSYKDNVNSLATVNYTQSESFVSPFSKTQYSNHGQHKSRITQSSMQTEPAINMYGKVNEIPRKHESFKRAGSMQVANVSEISKDIIYNFIPPQSLQTICNGNNATNSVSQPSDKNTNSIPNTISSSGVNSATASTASYCKNCKKLEDQEKLLTFTLIQFLNQVTDVVDKEKLWRQGTIGFELNNFGWTPEDEQSVDPKILKKFDSGRLFLEIKKQFLQVRKGVEELIIDVENLSKTNPYMNIEIQKENRNPSLTESSQMPSNPGRKLLASIAEAKQYVDSLRSAVFSEEIPPEIKDEIKSKNKRDFEDKNVLRTLTLQLEQSKRERRMLEIELSLQRKGVLQNQNVSQASMRQMIRQIIDEETKSKHRDEFVK